ncbi:MAG: ATP-binding protein [Chloroflexota bacterium]
MTDSDAQTVFPGDYVSSEDLVGRDEFIRHLAERLRSGRNVVLMAPRRTGKTSIARDVLRRLAASHVLTAYIDFLATTDKRDFAERVAEQLHEQTVRRNLRTLTEHLPDIKPHVRFALIEFGVDISAKEQDENKVFAGSLELPQRAAEKKKTRAVICLDEFQEAGTTFGANVYKLMRGVFQQQANTTHLFMGSQHSMLRGVFSTSNAPFLRYADELQLPPISAQDWAEYIAAKFAEAKIGCSRVFAGRIAQRAGCHPGDVMVLCTNLYFLAKVNRAKALDEDLLDAAIAETKTQLKTYFDAVWSELTDRAKERLVALRIARGEPATRGGIAPQVAADAVRALINKGIVVRTGRGAYEYFEPLFKEYVLAL